MKNAFRVFWRDLKRLARVPAAWLVALFLVVLPSLYTWFNVYGFWNPYDNTESLRVCVVNEDAGTTDEKLGDLDIGSRVVSQLQENSQLGWAFVDRRTAMNEVASGASYAAFVIPETFSESIAALAAGDFEQSSIEYYVNEKTGPVAPKIMDTGANTLDASINSAFVSEVSSIVAETIDAAADKAKVDADAAKSTATARVDQGISALGKVKKELQSLSQAAEDAQAQAQTARQSLTDGKADIDALSGNLEAASALLGTANAQAGELSLSLGAALDSSGELASFAASQANARVTQTAAKATAAKGEVDAAVRQAQAALREQEQVLATLKQVEALLPDGDAKTDAAKAIATLDSIDAEANDAVNGLSTLSADIADTATKAAAATAALDAATQQALDAGSTYRSAVKGDTLPGISAGLASLAAASSSLSAAVASQALLLDQAADLLSHLDTTLGQSRKAFGETIDILGDAQAELASVKADLAAVSSSDALADLLGGNHIDSASVASFMLSPTKVETEELYPIHAYGSAMAPLFINLTLWIGVFMLMVIMRLEVDEEGLEDTTVSQRFFGRGMLLGCMAALQAIVCCAGCLVIGVQAANVPLFILTAVVASLAYLAIQYSLSATLQHVGKALCVILVFVQIPGASGLYPIEMTPDFFQVVYPLFPFTYGINAIRETVFGFYGNLWVGNIAMLLLFMAVFVVIGTVVRPYTANLNRLFAQQIEDTDLVNIEPVQLPDRRYRLNQLISAFADREEFRTDLEKRFVKFMRRYPHFKRAAAFAGIGAPIIATPILIALGVERVIILTVWLAVLVAVVSYLVVIEFIRDNMLHQVSLGNLSSAEIRDLYYQRAETARRTRRWNLRAGRGQQQGRPTSPEEAAKGDMPGDMPDDAPNEMPAAEPAATPAAPAESEGPTGEVAR